MTIAEDRRRASDPGTPDEELITLLTHRDWHVRWNAAQNPGASDKVRIAALANGDKDLAGAVGQLGDALSERVLAKLFEHPARNGREKLGWVTESESVLNRLATDPDPKVRTVVAQRKVPAAREAISRLASDPKALVRAGVASNSTIPDEVAFGLTSDRSALVREWLLMVRDHDSRFAEIMQDDPDEHIRRHARGVLARQSRSAEDEGQKS